MGYIDGIASNSKFNRPQGVAENNGTIFIADSDNFVIRRIKNGGVYAIFSSSWYNYCRNPIYFALVFQLFPLLLVVQDQDM